MIISKKYYSGGNMQPDFIQIARNEYINRNAIINFYKKNSDYSSSSPYEICIWTLLDKTECYTVSYSDKSRRDEIFNELLTGDKQS